MATDTIFSDRYGIRLPVKVIYFLWCNKGNHDKIYILFIDGLNRLFGCLGPRVGYANLLNIQLKDDGSKGREVTEGIAEGIVLSKCRKGYQPTEQFKVSDFLPMFFFDYGEKPFRGVCIDNSVCVDNSLVDFLSKGFEYILRGTNHARFVVVEENGEEILVEKSRFSLYH